jgi:hypothetical protein
MRRFLALALVLLLPACHEGPFDPHDRERELVGTYWAESVDGLPVPHQSHSLLAAELRLRSDGTFSEWWILVDDEHEYHGRWRLVGDDIRLTMSGEYVESAYVYGRRLEMSESGIVYARDRDYR